MKEQYYIYVDEYPLDQYKSIVDLLGEPTQHPIFNMKLFQATKEQLSFLSLQLPNFNYWNIQDVDAVFNSDYVRIHQPCKNTANF